MEWPRIQPRRGDHKVAQRFSAGKVEERIQVPEGQPSSHADTLGAEQRQSSFSANCLAADERQLPNCTTTRPGVYATQVEGNAVLRTHILQLVSKAEEASRAPPRSFAAGHSH